MGQKGEKVEPTQVDVRRGRCAVCASSVEGSGSGGRKGGKRAHLNRYPVRNGRILYVVGKEAVEGSDAWLERSRNRPGGFKEPRNKIHKLGKGERWNGRGGAEQLRSEPIQTDARFQKLITGENQITTTRKMGVAGW